jgi:Na+-driven multidrug efflux pump
MLFKFFIVAILAAILLSLGTALFRMVTRRGADDHRMGQALTWRIGLSVALFVLLMVAILMGWIQPHGLAP